MGAIGKGLLVALVALRVVNFDVGKKPDSVKTFIPDGRIVTTVRIGILPFTNLSEDANAGEKIMQPLITYLLSTGKFTVIDPLIIEQAFIKYKIRSLSELSAENAQSLMKELNMKHVMIGTITSFKSERVGSDSYPVISLSARLLNLEDMSVAWATSITRTGKDKAKIFDIGRVDILDNLVVDVVNEVASSMGRNINRITPEVAQAPTPEAAAAAQPGAPQTQPEQPQKPRFPKLGDSTELSEADQRALLSEVAGYTRGEVFYEGDRFNRVALTKYQKDNALFLVELTDYKDTGASQKFMKMLHPSLSPMTVDGFAVYKSTSPFGLLVLEVNVGRLVLKVAGNPANETALQQLALELAKGLAQ